VEWNERDGVEGKGMGGELEKMEGCEILRIYYCSILKYSVVSMHVEL